MILEPGDPGGCHVDAHSGCRCHRDVLDECLVEEGLDARLDDVSGGCRPVRLMPLTVEERQCELLLLSPQGPVFAGHRPGGRLIDKPTETHGHLRLTNGLVLAVPGSQLVHFVGIAELHCTWAVPAHHGQHPEGVVRSDVQPVSPALGRSYGTRPFADLRTAAGADP